MGSLDELQWLFLLNMLCLELQQNFFPKLKRTLFKTKYPPSRDNVLNKNSRKILVNLTAFKNIYSYGSLKAKTLQKIQIVLTIRNICVLSQKGNYRGK